MTRPIRTARLTLRPWRKSDRPDFAALNADLEVTADLGGPLSRAASDAKFDRYRATFDRHGFSRLAVEDEERGFVGYAGLMPSAQGHPLGPHIEIGWRLVRAAWGKGYASEAARAVLDDAFIDTSVREIVAYTAADNPRSQAVMERLGMRRDPARDFETLYGTRSWRGLVWVAEMRRPVTQV